MKYLLFISASLSLMSCGSTVNWKAERFVRHECSLPEKLAVEASIDGHFIQMTISNSTRELWQFDINSSTVRILTPRYPWSSALADNHAGEPNKPKSALLPGNTNYTLYPMSLIQETDDELSDVHWRPWPIIEKKKNLIAELRLVFIDPDGANRICVLSGEFKPQAK